MFIDFLDVPHHLSCLFFNGNIEISAEFCGYR